MFICSLNKTLLNLLSDVKVYIVEKGLIYYFSLFENSREDYDEMSRFIITIDVEKCSDVCS